MTRKIILDCDPGHDDAIAILLAAGSPELEILAVTTVAGNHSIEETTRNALVVADVAGLRGVPIAAGAARPLVRLPRWAEHIHGATGMDGPAPRETRRAADKRHAVSLIAELIMSSSSQEITLVPTGPLTNIALAARMFPEIVARVNEVVFMGGAYAAGNITATAEFNVYADPEAAQIVLAEAWPVTMVGLDLTHQAVATRCVRDRIASIGTEASRFVGDLLDYVQQSYAASVEKMPDPPVHDPCAVMRVLAPELVSVQLANVEVELHGAYSLGSTVTDFLGRDGALQRTKVATRLEVGAFWDRLIAAIARLPN